MQKPHARKSYIKGFRDICKEIRKNQLIFNGSTKKIVLESIMEKINALWDFYGGRGKFANGAGELCSQNELFIHIYTNIIHGNVRE